MIELNTWTTILLLLGMADVIVLGYVLIKCLITGKWIQIEVSWGDGNEDCE